MRTVPQAARWIDEVGLALLFPKPDVVLPSLWEQVSPHPRVEWGDEQSHFFWRAKDDLPGRGLSCVGKHLGRRASCVAPRLLPVLVAACGDPVEGDDPVVEAIRELGPSTGPALRAATGLEKKELDRRVASLHHRLVLTNSHLVAEGGTWGALAHELLARKWALPERLPDRGAARRELARLVLDQARELSAADLGGALGWRRPEAAAVLDEVAEGRDDPAGFRIWTRG